MEDSKKDSGKKSIEPRWRVGKRVRLNVYAGKLPICQCHSEDMAELIVNAVNSWNTDMEKCKDAKQLRADYSKKYGVSTYNRKTKVGDMEIDVKSFMRP